MKRAFTFLLSLCAVCALFSGCGLDRGGNNAVTEAPYVTPDILPDISPLISPDLEDGFIEDEDGLIEDNEEQPTQGGTKREAGDESASTPSPEASARP